MASALFWSVDDRSPSDPLPPLEQGQHLDRETFHERYCAMPPGTHAELIQGKVYMPSPLYSPHSLSDGTLVVWLGLYVAATPGTRPLPGISTCLGEDGEVQPDQTLVIEPARGGQVREDERKRLAVPPELVVEVASSSESYDLHEKYDMYERSQVREYLVVLVLEKAVRWFTRTEAGFTELQPEPDGLLRSRVFPGLWLDPDALIRHDIQLIKLALDRGLASAEHEEFVQRLQAAAP